MANPPDIKRSKEFLVSQADGSRSIGVQRFNSPVDWGGAAIPAGQVYAIDGGSAVDFDGSIPAAGILLDGVNALEDVRRSTIVRDAEVEFAALTYSSTDDEAASSLQALGIVAKGGAAEFVPPAEIGAYVISAASISPSTGDVGDTYTITRAVFGGTAPITVTGVLTLDGVDVTGDMVGDTYTAAGDGDLVWTETATNAARPGGVVSTDTAVVSAVVPVTGVTAIGVDGWRATYPTPPAEFDPETTPETFTVSRAGYDASGSAATVTDTLTLMKRVREPFPDEATLTSGDVSLSDFIYSTDSILGVTNNSTRPAPLPIARWGVADREIARGSTYDVKLAVAHAHARNGKPVAGVLFTASDGTNTVSQLVTDLQFESYDVSSLGTSYYKWSIPLAALDDAAEITVDAEIRPWVGAAYTISTDAEAYPSPNLSVLKFLNDSADTYGQAHAYVDATSGNDGTGAVSAVKATAATTPYLTMSAAATALKAFNLANYSRDDAGGATMWLKDDTHVQTSMSSAASGDWPITIRAETPALRDATVITDTGATVQGGTPRRVKFLDLTFKRSSGKVIFLDTFATTSNLADRTFSLENVYFDSDGVATYAGWMYRTGIIDAIECSGDWSPFGGFSNNSKMVRAVGCRDMRGTVFSALACYGDMGVVVMSAVGEIPASKGTMAQDCHFYQTRSGSPVLAFGEPTGKEGVALVGCILEAITGDTTPGVQFWADNNLATVENFVGFGLTIVGSRLNVLYQDDGTVRIDKTGYFRNVVSEYRNTKTDVFPTASGNRVGNWPAVYNVGFRNNTFPRGSNNGGTDVYGYGSWLGDVKGLGDTSAGGISGLMWTDDASFTGTGLGGGDYTPQAGTQIATIPAFDVHAPFDQLGRALPLDGSARGGALQPE